MKQIFTNLFSSTKHLIIICFVLIIVTMSNKIQAQATYNATGSWTCPAGITSVTVQCWGAGGAGGGNPTNADGGGGGGGGAFTSKVVTVSQGNTYNFTVGVGGTGVVGGNGNVGTDTYFPTVTPQVKALGGQGGFKPVGGAAGVGGNGGASSGIGTIFWLGGNGGYGRNANNGNGGPGGSSAGTSANGWSGPITWSTVTATAGPAGSGIGGDGGTPNNDGAGGLIPGGGGGGSGDGNRKGGNGANGQVNIIYPSFTFSPSAICAGTTPTITLTGLNLTGATAVKFNGVNASSFTVVNSTTITAVPPAGATTGYITVTIGSNIPSSLTQFTVNALPTITVTPNWCTGGGFVGLQATTGMATYLWNTGATTSFISVSQAANYSVTATNGAGCSNSGSLQVGTELVTNGNFSAGNIGFTSTYGYVSTGYTGVPTSGLWPEGKYAVGNNPNFYHPAFYGTDHTNGSGNFMIINGDPVTGSTIWAENGLTVTPNTNYYFSAWGLSVYNGNNAVLQFAVNGLQVGTVAYLPNGYTVNTGPYTWVKFFGSWNSGPATTANISIVDLQTILGGNDFGLDDISFGTLSPVSLGLAADANGNSGTCIGDPLILNSNAVGGISPFTYAWSGPSSYSSTLANPLVSASAIAGNSGTYAVTVTDVHGCTASSNTTITVSAPPTTSLTTAPASASVCSGTSTTINISNSQSGVFYQLRNNVGNINIGSPVAGTGVATPINLPTGNLTSTTTFNVLASNFSTDCSSQLTTTPTVTVNATPVLIISNQTICTGTVDLTLPAVTSGSTGGGTLTYWTNAGCTIALGTPASVNANGTYYIKATTASGCVDIKPVVVNIGSVPAGAAINYSGSPFCSSGNDPSPILSGGAFADVFSSTAGLTFLSASTGQIDLSVSTAGTYTVTLTMTPGGACPVATRTTSITVTAAPLANFSYATSGLCQSVNAIDPTPIFSGGSAAGTFTSSSGLLSINAGGVIDISASTPGNYAVINTRAATGGCAAVADTEAITINPYTFTGSLNSSASTSGICLGQSVDLYSAGTSYLTVLLTENFNGSFNSWDKFNTSTGGTPANATWTLRASPYTSGVTFSSNDATQFYLSNSASQGAGGTTNTILQSPVMSTIGYSTLSLNFYHYYRDNGASGDDASVEVSTNGSTWTSVANYTTTQGASNGFVNVSISLNAYVAQPSLYVRFRYAASNDFYWAIDNVVISGSSTVYDYAWTSSPVGFTSSIDNPTGVTPLVNTFYVVTATNNYGCSTPTSPVPVAVNTPPSDHAGADVTTCSGSPAGIGAASTFGNTYSWSPSTGLSSTTASNPNASPTITTTYTLTETVTSTGCSSINKVVVTVNPVGQWLGTISTDWNVAGNWCGGIPTSTTDVIIPAGALTNEPSVYNLIPGPALCRNLTIGAGHTLSVLAGGDLKVYGAITITGTYTHTGGTLELVGTFAGGQTLPSLTAFNVIINNTSGSGVTVGGNLTVNGNLTVDNSIFNSITTIKTLNIAGNIILQNGGYMDDNCTDFLNITTSSATAAQIFRGNGQLIKCLNLTSVKTAGSLNFSVTGGATDAYIQNNLLVNYTGVTASFNDNGNTLSVGNNAQMGGTSNANYNLTGTLKFICIGATLATDNHLSDYAGTGVTVAKLNHLLVLPENGSVVKTVQFYPAAGGQTVYVNGNLTIDPTNSPTLDPLNNNISLMGNWTDYASSGFTEGTGQVVFAGTVAAQTIFASEIFNKIEINNANGVTLNNFILVSSELKLTNGRLNTGANQVQVTSNAVTSVVSYSTASYVNGNLLRSVSTTNNLVYDFPVGDAANYELATLKFTNTSGLGATPTVLAFFTSGLPATMPSSSSCTINGSGTGGMLNAGFWTLTPSAYTTGTTTYDVTLVERGSSNFAGNANQLGIIKRHDNTIPWKGTGLTGGAGGNEGFHSNATQTFAAGVATAKRTGVKSFSDFGIGYSANPLPVELTTFTANAVDNKAVDLFWNTQAELNCNYFSVERSANGIEFTEIGKVTGHGTSQISHDYSFVDNSPLCGTAYYRLMQVDENGDIHYTPIVSAIINCSTSFSIYPNPTMDYVNINLNSLNSNSVTVKIIGLDGKIYLQNISSNNQLKLDVSKLPAGFYFISIENGNDIMKQSFIKE